jgi:hypothetical protein
MATAPPGGSTSAQQHRSAADLVRPCAHEAARPMRQGVLEFGIESAVGPVRRSRRRRENAPGRQMRDPAIKRLVAPLAAVSAIAANLVGPSKRVESSHRAVPSRPECAGDRPRPAQLLAPLTPASQLELLCLPLSALLISNIAARPAQLGIKGRRGIRDCSVTQVTAPLRSPRELFID